MISTVEGYFGRGAEVGKIPAFDIGYRHEDEDIGGIELMVDDCSTRT
jgi:hypothetical protein